MQKSIHKYKKAMKKLLAAFSLVLGMGLANAQQVAPTTTKQAPAKVEKATKSEAKKETMAAKAEATKPAAKMKKDGTPDKRYKANMHLKKDGTPDKRYKENK